MKILYPIVKGGSGGDIYFERLSRFIGEIDIKSQIVYYPTLFEMYPKGIKYFYKLDNDCDIIHSASDWGFAFKDKSKPLIVIAHHLVFEPQANDYKSIPQKAFHKLLYGYNKSSFNVADKIIAMSIHTKNAIQDIFDIDDVQVIYNGIETDVFKPTQVINNMYKNKIKLLYVGNLIKRKGSHILPKIMEKLDNRFVLFYTSGLRSKKIFQNENMIPLGRLDLQGLINAYNLCDMLLVPSIVEGGFSYAAAEAMACMKPVVASKSSGLFEMIGDQGGAICGSPLEFAEKIKELADDKELREAMGTYNRKKVLRDYNMSHTAQAYAKVYKEYI